jgi:hypothetical protein
MEYQGGNGGFFKVETVFLKNFSSKGTGKEREENSLHNTYANVLLATVPCPAA